MKLKELRNNYVWKKKISLPKSNHLLMESFMLRWLGRERGEKHPRTTETLAVGLWGKWVVTCLKWKTAIPYVGSGSRAMSCLCAWWSRAIACGDGGCLCFPTAGDQEFQAVPRLLRIWGLPPTPYWPLLLWRGRRLAWDSQGRAEIIG